MEPRYCFILPCYQHSETLDGILKSLQKYRLKTFIIDDGSQASHASELQRLAQVYENIEVVSHTVNKGKGAAVSTGFYSAYAQDFTHAVQIDSDGQHDLSKVDDLFALSREFPEDVISGRPQYDTSVPKSRLYGRYATHIWVWIETLSLHIKDSMCGFRVYPLKTCVQIIKNYKLGQRMDFDAEILVRLYWAGLSIHQFFVPVRYPENGVSHFHVLKDNLRISKMHTRLFFGMVLRFPRLLFRKHGSPRGGESWHQIEEFGGLFGIRILLLVYKILGQKVLKLILYPVCFYYSMISSNARQASVKYRENLNKWNGSGNFSTFQHIYSFALAMLDKFAVWSGEIAFEDIHSEDVQLLHEISKSGQGAFFLTSHFGNIEVCRALGRFYSDIQFHALVYHENAKNFNKYLNKVNSESSLNLISVQNVGPEISIFLKDKLDRNHWVFMVGDRLSVRQNPRTLDVSMVGATATVSEGPFVLSYVLDVPTYVIHCFREGNKFRLQVKPMIKRIERTRANRQEYVQDLAQQYASELETVIVRDPRQWYNFFDFWRAKV